MDLKTIEEKIVEATPIVKGWLDKLKDEGHILYEEVKVLEQELVDYLKAHFSKKPVDAAADVPTATVPSANAEPTAPANKE